MMKPRLRLFVCLLLAATVLTAFAALAGGVGSQGDPLVTLSYLNDNFTKQVLEEVDKAIDRRDAAIEEELDKLISQAEQEIREELDGSSAAPGAAPSYAAVTLSAGQTLTGSAGCEVILRSGAAACSAAGSSAPGLVDATTGGILASGGALAENHLYLMTDTRAVTAASGAVLLVRGSYTVG